MNHFKTSLTIIFVFFFGITVYAQEAQVADSTAIWQIITNDENEFIGNIISETPETIKLKTEEYGTIDINRDNIYQLVEMNKDKLVDDEYWPDHLQSTRYFWAPSGYALPKGDGYYQNVWVFFNQFSWGITDYFSCGIGTIPIVFMGGDVLPLWITPKFSIPLEKDKANLAAGVLMGTIIGDEEASYGIAYGNLTLGPIDKNISLGIGYGFSGDGWSKKPVSSFSGISRVSKKGYMLMENYLIPDGDSFDLMMLLGGRTVWRNVSLDYGAMLPIVKGSGFIAIPWLSLIVPFSPNN